MLTPVSSRQWTVRRISAAWMPRAAILPSWTASTISPPLRRQSPPAKSPGMLVAPVARSTTILPLLALQLGQGSEQIEERLLAECLDDHVGGEDEVRAGYGPHAAGPRSRVLELGPDELDALRRTSRRRGCGPAGQTTRTGRRRTWPARTRRRTPASSASERR